ncbi:MAG: hypothetical protein U0793_07495 [Gemmataceae bacterium]
MATLYGRGRPSRAAPSPGELLIVMAYLAQLYSPLETLSKKIADLQGSLVRADRAFALLDATLMSRNGPDARPLHRAKGSVTFASALRVPGQPLGAARRPRGAGRCSCRHRAGKTGAGKTTLISLLTPLRPLRGGVLVDGVDFRATTASRDPAISSPSSRSGIRPVLDEHRARTSPTRPGASRTEKNVAAAKAANAHDFIAALPDDYDTLVESRGMRWPGGSGNASLPACAFLMTPRFSSSTS